MQVDAPSLIVVEQIEDTGYTLLSLFISKLCCDRVQEVIEVDTGRVLLSVEIRDHLVDRGVLALEAETLHRGLELLGVDEAGAIGIEEVESLPYLLDLVLGESWPLEGLASDGRFLTCEFLLLLLLLGHI